MPTGTVPRETVLGVASSVDMACVLPAPIPSIARSKNPRKTRAPSLFFLDRQTLGGKVSGRPDRKKLERKTLNGPVSLTSSQATGACKCEATGQKRLMRTVLFLQLRPDPSPVPSDRAQNANPMMHVSDEVIIGFPRWQLPVCESRNTSRPFRPRTQTPRQ